MYVLVRTLSKETLTNLFFTFIIESHKGDVNITMSQAVFSFVLDDDFMLNTLIIPLLNRLSFSVLWACAPMIFGFPLLA